jgi:hypothetical protein
MGAGHVPSHQTSVSYQSDVSQHGEYWWIADHIARIAASATTGLRTVEPSSLAQQPNLDQNAGQVTPTPAEV